MKIIFYYNNSPPTENLPTEILTYNVQLETIAEDAPFVLDLTGKNISFPHRNELHNAEMGTMNEIYRNVSLVLLRPILRYYQKVES